LETRVFQFQRYAPNTWKRVVDTSCSSPLDIFAPGEELAIDDPCYVMPARSVAVFIRDRVI
jgi:hypothetical protein